MTTAIFRIAVGLILVLLVGACSSPSPETSHLAPIYRMWHEDTTLLVLTDHDNRPDPCRSFELTFDTTNPDEVLVAIYVRPVGSGLCSMSCRGGTLLSADIPEGVQFAKLKRHPDTPPGNQSECGPLGFDH